MNEVQENYQTSTKSAKNPKVKEIKNLPAKNLSSERKPSGTEKRNSSTVENNTRYEGLLDENQDTQYPFFTEKAFMDMALGKIPDFESLYEILSGIKVSKDVPLSAIQFLPALRQFTITDRTEIENFIKNPETNHVLVQNDQIKIVLIRWQPGDESKIHGHADGGCVFKVLHGKIVEKRFSSGRTQRLLAEGTYQKDNIAYIDDIIGLHSVGNPYSSPAITLHMYTPGNYKLKKR
jgi:hypothetical protein